MKPLRALVHAHVGASFFVCALSAGVFLHLAALPLARRVVILDVNRVLRSALAGQIVIDRIGWLGLNRIDGLDAHADDPAGHAVARIEGASARVSTLALLRSVLGSHGPLVIDIPELSIERAEVLADEGEDGTLRLARAFALRSPPPENEPAGRGARVMLPRIRIDHATVRSEPTAPFDGEVDDATASLSLSPEGLNVDLSQARLRVRGFPQAGQAQGEARAHLEWRPIGGLVVRASWDGGLGPLRERANVTLAGTKLDAIVDAGPITPDTIHALVPMWPIAAPGSVHLELHGNLPRVEVATRASLAGGTVDLTGPLTVGPAVAATLHVSIDGIDGRSLVAPLPFAGAGGEGDIALSLAATGALQARIAFALARGTWAGTQLPPTTIMAEVARATSGDETVHADVTLREPGAPVLLHLDLAPKAGVPVLAFDLDANIPRLEDVVRFGGVAAGAVHVRGSGTVDLAQGGIDAQASAVAADLRVAGTALRHVRAEVHASGKLSSPTAILTVDGEDLVAGSAHVAAFHATTNFSTGDGMTWHDVEVDLAGEDGPPVRVEAATASVTGGIVRIDQVVALGLGEPIEASVSASSSSLSVQAKSAGIDLARLGTFAPLPLRAGKLSLDVDATVDRQSAEGHALLELSHGSIAGLKDAAARVDVTLHGRHVAGRIAVSADDIGTIDARASSLEVGRGELLREAPWRQAWGAIDVTADIDLAKLRARVFTVTGPSAAGPPVDEVRGRLAVAVRLERDSESDMTPEVDVTAHTTGLAITGRNADGGWSVENVDPELHAVVNGNTGATSLTVRVHDEAGPLATLEVTSGAVPYVTFFSDASVVDALRATPFEAHLEVPPRRLSSLPAVLGTRGMRGTLNAKLDWHGAVAKPTIDLAATLARGPSDPKLVALPIDLAFAGHYDGAHLDATMSGSSRGATVIDASARIEARARDLVSGLAAEDIPWSATGRARLDKLPLRDFTALDERQVRGSVSGEVSVSGLHDDAHARAALTFDDLQVGDAACKTASAHATANGQGFDGALEIGDASGGSMEARAHFGAHWGRALVPALDASQTAQASLLAKHFRAGLLLPFISGTFSQLDGLLDADARVAIDPAHELARPEGSISIKDGTFELASMGGEFHAVGAKLVSTPDGVVRLENAVAFGPSGEVLASATARMNGFALDAARATVVIPRTAALPLVFDGVQLGVVDGHFDVTLNKKATGLDVAVQVPSLHLDLPTGASARDVQPLGGLDGVRVGFVRGGRQFVAMPLDGANEGAVDAHVAAKLPIRIAVKLGGDVQVTRGTDLEVLLEGQPTITIASDVRVAGQIRMTRGSLDVKGKAFLIERGTVSFVGDDPANPQVLLTAGWNAPDGTRIYADFVGPLKTGKVTLRAEPARPQNEILALLLFGTTDDSSDAGNSSAQVNMAAQAGGAVATEPINQALGGVNRTLDKLGLAGGLSTKLDTSQPNPRPEVALQIARDISLQIAWVLGVPPVTSPDLTLVTLNWNFLRKWSLETTVGDAGTSIVDVVWQHRY